MWYYNSTFKLLKLTKLPLKIHHEYGAVPK